MAQQFQRSPCQRDDLAFTILAVLVIRLDVLVGNAFDHLDDSIGFGDQAD